MARAIHGVSLVATGFAWAIFHFVVGLDEGQGLEMPPPEAMTVVPDHIEQLVQEDILKSGVQLLDEEALTGDAEFESALFGVKEEVP